MIILVSSVMTTLVFSEGGRTRYKNQNILSKVLMVMKCHFIYKKQNWRGSKMLPEKALEK